MLHKFFYAFLILFNVSAYALESSPEEDNSLVRPCSSPHKIVITIIEPEEDQWAKVFQEMLTAVQEFQTHGKTDFFDTTRINPLSNPYIPKETWETLPNILEFRKRLIAHFQLHKTLGQPFLPGFEESLRPLIDEFEGEFAQNGHWLIGIREALDLLQDATEKYERNIKICKELEPQIQEHLAHKTELNEQLLAGLDANIQKHSAHKTELKKPSSHTKKDDKKNPDMDDLKAILEADVSLLAATFSLVDAQIAQRSAMRKYQTAERDLNKLKKRFSQDNADALSAFLQERSSYLQSRLRPSPGWENTYKYYAELRALEHALREGILPKPSVLETMNSILLTYLTT